MKRLALPVLLFGGMAFFAGCSLSPADKVAREQALQQAVLAFAAAVVQGNWPQAYASTDGTLGTSDQLKSQLTKSWVQDATLTNGDITSLAWVDDHTAKVKLAWSFQAGSVQSFSNETFVWVWHGNGWKYKGRALR